MSEARNQRFEIDIDEIERQLRRSVDAAPPPKADPLAELARIVGQDDPFRGILGGREGGGSNVHAFPKAPPAFAPEPVVGPSDRGGYGERRSPPASPPPMPHAVSGYQAAPQDHAPPPLPHSSGHEFDPVGDAYGSLDAALDSQDLQPLRPRRSRGRIAAVLAVVVVVAGAASAGLYWRKSGGMLLASGSPPVITADKSPLKVAPENPGGVEVPNQNRQIYDRTTPEGQSRVVDGREQPIDVREAARALPQPAPQPSTPVPPTSGGTISARNPVPSSDVADAPRPPSDVAAAVSAQPSPGSRGALNALGEPHRVRTVSIRPDGTVFTPGPGVSPPTVSDASIVPGGTLPAPVTVATVPVSNRPVTGAGLSPGSPVAPASPPVASSAPVGPAVTVLPPVRPRLDRRVAAPDEAPAPAPTRVAAAPTNPAAAASSSTERPAAQPAGRKYSVQIAVRPSEEEARSAYSQLQDKYATELDGRSARVTKAEVGGKTVHRVRVGPMSKEEADGLCSRMKSSGGSCFVAAN